jgi:hypothetical protein
MTTGAPEFMYNPDGIQGDIDTVSYIFKPIRIV